MIGWNRRWAAFTLLLIVCHFLLRAGLGVGGLAPDLLTAAALLGGRRLSLTGAAAFGLVLGALADAFAVTGFGASGFALGLIAALGSLSRDFFEGESLLFTAGYLFAGTWSVILIADALAGRGEAGLMTESVRALAAAAYTTAAGIGALAVYRRIAGPRW